MGDVEWEFLQDQTTKRKMYCEDCVDHMWIKSMERRKRDVQSLDKMREDAEKEKKQVASFEDSEQSEDDNQHNDTDKSFSESSCHEDDGFCYFYYNYYHYS